MDKPDAYGRMAYRGLIAWPERLRREAPLLARALAPAQGRPVLDLGCGSGEHSRLLRELGFDPTGVDRSEAQLRAAREADPGGRYVAADLTRLAGLAPHAGALCLGNTLPHLCEEVQVRSFFEGLARLLDSEAPFLLQTLNYDRILARGERVFPLVVRPGAEAGEETLFLRLMTHGEDGRLTFTPATLRHRSGVSPALELLACEEVPLRAWRRAQVEGFLQAAGFAVTDAFGTMTGEPWTADSPDLVLVARRSHS